MATKIFEDLKQKFKSREGKFDIFIGFALRGFLIVTYTALAFNTIKSFFSFLMFEPLILYVSFLVFGFFIIPLNYGISFITENTFKFLNKIKRKYIGGR